MLTTTKMATAPQQLSAFALSLMVKTFYFYYTKQVKITLSN